MAPLLFEPGEEMRLEDVTVENVRLHGEGQALMGETGGHFPDTTSWPPHFPASGSPHSVGSTIWRSPAVTDTSTRDAT